MWHRGFFESVCDLTTSQVFHCSLLQNDGDDSDSHPAKTGASGAVNGGAGGGEDSSDAPTASYTLLPALAGTQTRFDAELLIPSSMVGKLIGKGGENIKRISELYSITCEIPPMSEISGPECKVRVYGFNEANVFRAKASIQGSTSSPRRSKGGASNKLHKPGGGGGGGGGGGRSKKAPATQGLVPDVILMNKSLNRRT